MKRITLLLLIGFVCLLVNPAFAQSTPYKNGMVKDFGTSLGKVKQTFHESMDAYAENERLGLRGFRWSDFYPTGIYAKPKTTIEVEVTLDKGANYPVMIIGTYNYFENKNPQLVQLKAGVNKIKVNDTAGLVWIRYTSKDPNSTATVHFKSGLYKSPFYVKGVTKQADFDKTLKSSLAKEVLMLGDRVMQVYSMEYARSINPQDNDYVLNYADKIWNWENEISGMDGSSKEHTPHAHNRILMVQTDNIKAGAYASTYGTAYGKSLSEAAFTKEITGNAWGTWHELGHEHQQDIWTWNNMTEVTVNVYSMAVERKLGQQPNRLVKEKRYPAAFAFLNSKDASKDFNIMTSTYDDHFTRLVMFQQLYLAFGDKFYQNIHKKARLEKYDRKRSDLDKQKWFVKQACMVSNTDLTVFFKQWGFQHLGADFYKEIAALKLPKPKTEPSTLREDSYATKIDTSKVYIFTHARTGAHTLDHVDNMSFNSYTGFWHQQWKFVDAGDGYYYIGNANSLWKVLTLVNNGTASGTLVQKADLKKADAQKWKVVYKQNGEFELIPKLAPSLLLDAQHKKIEKGTKLVIQKKNDKINQRFLLSEFIP